MRTVVRPAAAAVLFVMALLSAAPAAAAPASWESVEVTVHSEQSQVVMLVSGHLPQTAAASADVELALPAGAEVSWAGELLGGAPEQDPSVTYTKTTSGTVDVYRFQLTKSADGQIEASVPAMLTFDGTTYTSALKWTSSQDVPTVKLSVRIPSGAKIVRAVDGASVKPGGEAGTSYYTKTFTGVRTGQVLELPFSYTSAAPVATGTAPAPDATATLLVLAAGMVVVIGAVALVRRRRPSTLDGETGGEDAAGDEPSDEGTPAAAAGGISVRAKALAVVGAMAVVVLVAVTVTNASAPGWADGVLRKEFGAPGECTITRIPLTPAGDLKRDGEKVLASLRQLQGISSATLYADGPRIEVTFCESGTNAEAIRATLNATGRVTAGTPQTSPLASEATSAPATGGVND